MICSLDITSLGISSVIFSFHYKCKFFFYNYVADE